MKEYKFIFPDTSDIKVGDVVKIEEVRHVLTEGVKCRDCSLLGECDNLPVTFICGGIRTAAFKIEKINFIETSEPLSDVTE